MQDFGVASSHNLALRPPSCVKQASWCPRHFQKRNSPGSSVSVDTTSCQKLRRNKQMTPISSFASFLFPSDRVQLNESKTKLPQRAILIVRVTLMPVHFCNYLPRIQRCTISCEGKALIRFSHLGRNIPFNTWLIGSGKRLFYHVYMYSQFNTSNHWPSNRVRHFKWFLLSLPSQMIKAQYILKKILFQYFAFLP